MLRNLLKASLLTTTLLLTSCTGIPEGLTPVQPFELNRYLGEWHEIARLDHSFERGLTQVTANYSLNPDGTVKVLNRGYSEKNGEWNEAEGLAKMNGPADQGRLKVSFFGPFYGAYNIVKLAPDYSMALIVGPDLTYGWILARSPNPDKTQCQEFYAEATRIGISPDSWIRLSPC